MGARRRGSRWIQIDNFELASTVLRERGLWVTGGGLAPAVPTERGVLISHTTLFGSWFKALRVLAAPCMGNAAWVAAAALPSPRPEGVRNDV